MRRFVEDALAWLAVLGAAAFVFALLFGGCARAAWHQVRGPDVETARAEVQALYERRGRGNVRVEECRRPFAREVDSGTGREVVCRVRAPRCTADLIYDVPRASGGSRPAYADPWTIFQPCAVADR